MKPVSEAAAAAIDRLIVGDRVAVGRKSFEKESQSFFRVADSILVSCAPSLTAGQRRKVGEVSVVVALDR